MTNADINKYILNERAVERDPEGYMFDLPPWDASVAEKLAAEEGIVLTDEHWEVVQFLRERFRHQGQVKSGRVLADELDSAFHGRGGSRYLYGLFPNGPVAQGSRIAGLPLPAYTTDPSFGSAE